MTTRIYLARITPVLWCSALAVSLAVVTANSSPAAPKRAASAKKNTAKKGSAKKAEARPVPPAPPKRKPGAQPAALVVAYRESPTPAHRKALETWADAHSREPEGALARLGLGIAAYEHQDFATASAALAKAGAAGEISDYQRFYLAATRLEVKEYEGIPAALAPVHAANLSSPLAAKAWLVESRALKAGAPAAAVRLLREHYAELPQPEGDLRLAEVYQAAGDLPHAAESYQRAYYQNISGASANMAGAALTTLKDVMGASYPQPSAELLLRRADLLLDARDYARARAEYRLLAERLQGLPGEQARVRAGAVDYFAGSASRGAAYLRGLELSAPEADAERWYYAQECARDIGDDNAMAAAIKRLERYPSSPWRLRALVSSGNRYLLVNRAEAYVPLYRAAYQSFPDAPAAATAHWKVAFNAYLRGEKDAPELLREQLRNYPNHSSASAALYFLARKAEDSGDWGTARAFYQHLQERFANTYYAAQARTRMERRELASASAPAAARQLLASIPKAAVQPLEEESTAATRTAISRSRLLRTAGLDDLADTELRFSSRHGGQPALLALEMGRQAAAPHTAMRILKSMTPDYLSRTMDSAPRQYWELLFPLPYRDELMLNAKLREIDPYLLAGLVRQESEFNPSALSRANAYGLTQVRPATGRLYARKAGVAKYNARSLFQPAVNLKIGTAILRSMLDHYGGKVEETLAAYNAGPNRVVEWLGWNNYREPAEFVESIPFTETREYVQAVMRNAEMYRRLYR